MAAKTFRFALGTPTLPMSGIWRLWVEEDDVHLEVQAARERVALTAYRTGRWRIEAGGAVSRWNRPREFRPGWIRGPDIVIPSAPAGVRPPDVDPYPAEPIAWLPPPPVGQQARVALLFAAVRSSEYPWRPLDTAGTVELVVLNLRSIGRLHLCRTDEPDDERSQRTSAGAASLQMIVSADPAGRPSFRESHDD